MDLTNAAPKKSICSAEPGLWTLRHGVFTYNNHIIEQTYASKIIKEMVHVFHGKDARGSKRGCIPPIFDALQ